MKKIAVRKLDVLKLLDDEVYACIHDFHLHSNYPGEVTTKSIRSCTYEYGCLHRLRSYFVVPYTIVNGRGSSTWGVISYTNIQNHEKTNVR